MTETVAFKYRAFLSYSHADVSWGKWLHRGLEAYRIDKDLVGRETSVGPVPKTLRPIFRDRDDFSAGYSLNAQTFAALKTSQFMIVICSPDAVRSQYVNEEIRIFKTLGRAKKIIPIIVEGAPSDSAAECFPPALRFKIDCNGVVTTDEPIAADVRPGGDGKELAKYKVVAGLLGVSLDEIVQRARQARKRRSQVLAATAGALLLLAVSSTVSAIYAWHELRTNEAFLSATLATATEIVSTAVAQAEKYNVPRTATLELLTKAEALFNKMNQYGRPTPAFQYQRASMLIEFARNYFLLGDTNTRLARVTEASELLTTLRTQNPNDLGYQRLLSVVLDELGDALVDQGKLIEALQAYHNSLGIAKQLTSAEPNNVQWQENLAISYERVGDGLVVRQGYAAEALQAFRNSLAIRETLARLDPNRIEWQHVVEIFLGVPYA